MQLIAPTVVCGLAVAVLVYSEIKENARLRTLAKPVASFAFLAVALFAADLETGVDLAIVIAQALGVVGDLALLRSSNLKGVDSKRWFAYGLFAFLVGHVAFIVGFCTVLSPLRWIRIAGWTVLGPVYVSVKTTRGIWSKLSPPLRKLVPIYVTVITVMVIGAIAIMSHGAWPGRWRLWWGALLFFISDVAVAQDLAAEDVSNRIWGLPCYYAGQLCIAWSLAA